MSLWELDYSRAGDMLRALHKSGVVDFGRYFRDNPDAVRELLRATRVVDVNDHTVAAVWRGSKQELLTNIEPLLARGKLEDYIAAVVSSLSGNKILNRNTDSQSSTVPSSTRT